DPRGGFPGGEAARALRRLGAEIEMWLHEHPVNRARAARGLLEANALWLWGGGGAAAGRGGADGGARRSGRAQSVAAPAAAWADDLYVDGLMRLRGIAPASAAQRWPATTGDALAVCDPGARPDGAALLALERDWLAPALARWRAGAVGSAILLAGDRAIRLQRPPWRLLMRRMRRNRPWWETLLR
ncbi:MAG: hypothetical protein KGJ52_10920, partial [Gammaproteobacteria bacterium]|nr:hypothetical protein [Gammaproteobacteria bacterium]